MSNSKSDDSSECYLVPAERIVTEEEIKNSRFISLVFRCQSAQQMKTIVNDLKITYPNARHYCYAFVAGAPHNSLVFGSSDDGEPAGSAGKPMLATLQGANIGEIGAVVIRYSGGIKLGVGGLVRAYSAGVKLGISQLKTQLKQIRYPGVICCEYHQLRDIEHLLSKHDSVIEDKVFADTITLKIGVPKKHKDELNRDLATASQGIVQAKYDD